MGSAALSHAVFWGSRASPPMPRLSLQQVKSAHWIPSVMVLDPWSNTRRAVPAPHSLRILETLQLFSSWIAYGLYSYNPSGVCPANHTGLPMSKRCFLGLCSPFTNFHSPWESHLVLFPWITLSDDIMPKSQCQHMSADVTLLKYFLKSSQSVCSLALSSPSLFFSALSYSHKGYARVFVPL